QQLSRGEAAPTQVVGQAGPGVRSEPDPPGLVPLDQHAQPPMAQVVGRPFVAYELCPVEHRGGGVRGEEPVQVRTTYRTPVLILDPPRPRTQAAGGSRSSISVRRCSNPASVSRPASSPAAAAEVAAVAPEQRGWDTRAIRPPGRNSRASSRSRAVGSGHMPTVLTASAALNGPSPMDRPSTDV